MGVVRPCRHTLTLMTGLKLSRRVRHSGGVRVTVTQAVGGGPPAQQANPLLPRFPPSSPSCLPLASQGSQLRIESLTSSFSHSDPASAFTSVFIFTSLDLYDARDDAFFISCDTSSLRHAYGRAVRPNMITTGRTRQPNAASSLSASLCTNRHDVYRVQVVSSPAAISPSSSPHFFCGNHL